MIKKILIANRGEIAVRIIRTCKDMGIHSVAVYSTADQESLHVKLADEAVCIGPALSKDSYLKMNAIIQAAINTNCDAIHPGFGFLSENDEFAQLVQDCGLIWIGPKPKLISMLGNKSEARKMMKDAGIPIIPGSKEIILNIEMAKSVAKEVGYPIMVKAANGGGGRGMRLVEDEEYLEVEFNNAKAEAKACFGNDEMYIEKYITHPKHVEVQVVGDRYGNVIHLFERDCSFQRRHQKMIEESPCHILTKQLRKKLYDSAIQACKLVNYDSLGTIEFLVDDHENYYFMEMNTRIQVEHPVTEMVTGIDIVKLQIQIASGHKLPYNQEDIVLQGCALECRINAENIANNFVPSPGTISFMHLPGGKGVRIDSAMYSGYTIPPYYDSMILKLITFGKNRLECIKKMRSALEELIIDGIKVNTKFHYCVMFAKDFILGNYDTDYCEIVYEELKEDEYFI